MVGHRARETTSRFGKSDGPDKLFSSGFHSLALADTRRWLPACCPLPGLETDLTQLGIRHTSTYAQALIANGFT